MGGGSFSALRPLRIVRHDDGPLFMLKRSLFFTLFLAPLAALHAADAPQARLDEKHRVFFKDNCLNCHNAETQKGKVRLADIAFSGSVAKGAELDQLG